MQQPENSPEIKQFIRERSKLFWYISEDAKENISLEVLIEFIFNYGDLDSVIQLINLIGKEKVATIFFNAIKSSDRKKGNYHELVLNYFTLLLNKYAS
jgi:hypothetical protein